MSSIEPNEPVNDTSAATESGSSDPGDIEADIARHREDLGVTVDELTDRLDVKKQAKRQVSDLKVQAADLKGQGMDRVQDLRMRVQQPNNAELAALAAQVLAVVAGVAAVAGTIWWWRR